MDFEQLELRIYQYNYENSRIFLTSSFQTQSLPLLHMISKIDNSIPVIFIDTGFHFSETIQFKDQVTNLLGLNTISLKSSVPMYHQRDLNGNFFFTSDPERCCHINKVETLNQIMPSFDIWISGVRADQSVVRSKLQVEEETPTGLLRLHPMLDWDARRIYEYRMRYRLPEHPLEKKGFLSVGCQPCTRKTCSTGCRSGRWQGFNKTECGLHTHLVKSSKAA